MGRRCGVFTGLAAFTIAVVCCLAPGCCAVLADSDTSFTGPAAAASPSTVAQIKPGETTREWVIATLGKPTSTSKTSDDTEILRYDCVKKVHNSATIFLILAANDRKESHQSVFVEIRDGVVQRCWQTGWLDAA
jgi:hypothetical protein